MKKVYISIDIGSDTIKIIVAEYYKEKFHILAFRSFKSKGVKCGLIVDANLTINALKDAFKELNNELGIEIRKVLVNIPAYNAKFLYTTSEINISSDEEIITGKDISKLFKKAVYSKLDVDYELITIIPLEFILDDEKTTDRPVGKKSKKLGLKGIIVSTPKKNVYSVVGAVEGAGLEVIDITFNSIGDYFEVKRPDLDRKVGAIINLGHETTTVSIYNKGKLMNTEVLQIGGKNIDKDLAYIFGINVFDAREVKEKFASAHKRFAQLNETYEVKNTVGETLKLTQFEVSEVVMARLEQILELAKKQILLLTKHSINYLILVGGLTEFKHYRHLALEVLSKDVIIYEEEKIGVRDNKYTSALGMIKYFQDKMDLKGKEYSMISMEDEFNLTSPRINYQKNDDKKITRIFSNFLNKEDKE